ncbi:MAG: hypothetical protein V4654_08840 [Bdellovibrionota bacterium]
MNTSNKLITETVEEIQRCMARVLDDCELEIGDSTRWKLLRSRLLKNFGDRGLTGKVREILTNHAEDLTEAKK